MFFLFSNHETTHIWRY